MVTDNVTTDPIAEAIAEAIKGANQVGSRMGITVTGPGSTALALSLIDARERMGWGGRGVALLPSTLLAAHLAVGSGLARVATITGAGELELSADGATANVTRMVMLSAGQAQGLARARAQAIALVSQIKCAAAVS